MKLEINNPGWMNYYGLGSTLLTVASYGLA